MGKRPVVSWKDIVRVLKILGYTFERQKGSHMMFSMARPKQGYGKIVVPKHNELDAGLKDDIIEDMCLHTGLSEK